jgi:hypothetical protein
MNVPHLPVLRRGEPCWSLDQLQDFPHIGRLNIGPLSTMNIAWDPPHEGNMFEFLWKRRSIERSW